MCDVIVLAPMAGGPSTPELAAAVSEVGGLGFLAAGYLTAAALEEQIARTRGLTRRPFGVNLFVPGPPSDRAAYEDYVAGLGEPRYHDDDWEAKLELVAEVEVVSFTFGCPDVLDRFDTPWVTVTTPEEARKAVESGAKGVIAQGAEAGGHRGSFEDDDDAPLGLIALLQLIDVDVPVIAAGGIATPQAVRAVRALGAERAQVGTAFMRAPEAGTTPVHAERLATADRTALTRAFSGRLARGIENRFMAEHPDAPSAYPEIHYATAGLRAEARKRGDSDGFNLWAGQAHALARQAPAGEITRWLAGAAE